MSFLNKAFQKLQAEAEKALDINNSNNDTSRSNDDDGSSSSLSMASVMHYDSNATRWEKAVVATDSIVRQVTKFDPDGVESTSCVLVAVCPESTKKRVTMTTATATATASNGTGTSKTQKDSKTRSPSKIQTDHVHSDKPWTKSSKSKRLSKKI